MKDADFSPQVRDEGKIKKAVVVSGGLIGSIPANSPTAGIEINVIELIPQLLTFIDWELAKLVENHVKTKSANIITDTGLSNLGDGRHTDRCQTAVRSRT
jgi:pyruvate/2-oxoglutarate dehydrogenase complex dihydrolipoamide dehydrogenase (E3) component